MSSGQWGGRIARALSLRVILFSLIAGIGVEVLVSLAWHGLHMWIVWLVAGLCYLVAVFNDEQMVRCAACGKRVKLGYSTCHHCGYRRA